MLRGKCKKLENKVDQLTGHDDNLPSAKRSREEQSEPYSIAVTGFKAKRAKLEIAAAAETPEK
ncbi:hypothetical protein HDU98_006676 [Podochytrium sp. JEL0797]|nr:hypothetical protein HDU98_006676 [Podochytrium sp. JEL0797]